MYGIPYIYSNTFFNESNFMKNSDSQIVLDGIRRIVKELRTFSKTTERDIGLSTAQIYVLQTLKDVSKPVTISELAAASHTHQSSVSVVVSKLVTRKLIEKTQDQNDLRFHKLKITSEGKYLLSKSPVSIQERLTKAVSAMSPSERKGLVSGIQALLEHSGIQNEDAPMLMED